VSIWGRIFEGVGELSWGSLFEMPELDMLEEGESPDKGAARADGTKQVGFTIAVIALGAKMAAADGTVSPEEVEAFHEVFQAPPEERGHVEYFFNLARRSTTGAETYARQAAKLLGGDKPMLEDLLGALFHIARADGRFDPGEDAYLRRIATIFGFSETEYRRIRAFHIGAEHPGHDDIEEDPFLILGLPDTATADEVRARWRVLVRENHPDLAIARGLPAEFVSIANAKLARINAAYRALNTRGGGS
jgi:DnaJ like chaperone protein